MSNSKSQQTYSTHTRFDPAYHFFLVPIVFLNLMRAGYALWKLPAAAQVLDLIFAFAFVIGLLKLRLYPLRVQDRLIRLEETLRLTPLLPAELAARLPSVTPGQFVALRFASDAEAPALVRRALDENLAPADIKKAISNWRPDEFRV